MADQDDAWHPDKLETLLAALGDAQLVYSDARIVDRGGAVLADTYWEHRAQQPRRPALAAGRQRGHRRGLAVPARAARRRAAVPARAVRPLPRPLARRSPRSRSATSPSSIGRSTTTCSTATRRSATRRPTGCTALRDRLGRLRRDPRERVRLWRMHYFVDVARLLQFATVLCLRCGDRMARRQAARAGALLARRPLAAGAGAAVGARGARARCAAGPRRSAPSGCSATRSRWRRAARGDGAATARAGCCASTRCRPRGSAPSPGAAARTALAARSSPRRSRRSSCRCATTRPQRVNLLIPTIDLDHFFGGYIAQVQPRAAARRARAAGADRHRRPGRRRCRATGGSDARVLRADSPGSSTRSRSCSGARRSGLEVSRADRFVATTWWSAHVAAHARRARSAAERVPLPDPGVRAVHLPDGHLRGAGERVLPLPALRAVLDRAAARLLPPPRHRGLRGGHARPGIAPRRRSRTRSRRSTRPRPRSSRGAPTRRLLFYARPEPHAARNMFELGVLALEPRARAGRARRGWELHGIGTVDARPAASTSAAARARAARRAPAQARLRATCCATTTSASRSCTRRTPAWCRSRWRRRGC